MSSISSFIEQYISIINKTTCAELDGFRRQQEILRQLDIYKNYLELLSYLGHDTHYYTDLTLSNIENVFDELPYIYDNFIDELHAFVKFVLKNKYYDKNKEENLIGNIKNIIDKHIIDNKSYEITVVAQCVYKKTFIVEANSKIEATRTLEKCDVSIDNTWDMEIISYSMDAKK